ncbi:MAG: SurA N-terminal domain-containing protein [Bacteroidetes bacterium]|nr:SurA N-terminal domain-containing protein [Bacteroidota bacterium]MCH8523925.1 SurA N-terminal domain-containing protein [Balneolales bacterium]
MERLRNSTKIIFWVLILSFGLLWGLADTGAIDAIMIGPRSLAEVNGRAITAEEYNARVNAFTQQYQEQTGEAPTLEMRAYYDELAWDELVLERIIDSEMERLGITVTDDEIVEMITGARPHPMVAQFFTREDGSIDRLALQAAIEAQENTPIWLNIEAQLREQRSREKLNTFIMSSLRVTDAEIEEAFIRENSVATLEFVRFPFSAVDEADISISDADIRRYYRANSNQFQRDRSWRFNFVEFSKLPTAQDTARIVNEVAGLRASFAAATNDSLFVRDSFSDRPFFGGWLNPSEINWFLADVVSIADGEVTEPIIHDNLVSIAKRSESRAGTEQFTRVRKIQLNFTASNRDAQLAAARDIIRRVNAGESFEEIARTNSTHGSSVRGGNLGYVARGDYSTAVGNAIFNTRVGALTQPLEDNNRIMIFQVLDRSNREIRMAQFSRIIDAEGGGTIRAQRELAVDFQEFAALDGFSREAERQGLAVQEGFATRDTPFITGIGQSRILLSELEGLNRRNAISDIIELDERFVVLQVTEILEAGTRPLEEVRAQIETTLRNERRRELTRSRVEDLLSSNSTLEALAAADGREVQRVDALRLSANTIPGAGREPKVVGAAFGVELNTVSRVIVGDNAAFVLYVTERTQPDITQIPSTFRNQTRERLQMEKNQAFQEVWIERLKEDAEIKDFRRFYM